MTPLQELQKTIGVNPDGSFGPATFKAARDYFKLSNARAAHFFGQVSHESGHLKVFSENLNYSAKGLLGTFGKYFNAATANSYARKPEAIANKVYANRMGNGPESSGDGWKFRGRGALQLTGRENYEKFAEFVNDPEVMKNPDLVATKYAFQSAMFYFERNNIWRICDEGTGLATIKKVTKLINGGYNGLDERVALTQRFAVYGN